MAATLTTFVLTRVTVAWTRPGFIAPLTRTFPIITDMRPNRLRGEWLLDYGLYDADGQKIRRVYRVACDPGLQVCGQQPAGAYNMHTYQPAERFWPFQYIEAGIFVALATVLLAVAMYRVRKHLS